MIEKLKNISTEYTDIVNQYKDMVDTINNELPELNQKIEQVRSYISENGIRKKRNIRYRREELKMKNLLKNLKEIEEKGKRLMGIYDAARLESQNGIAATHIYEDLFNALSDAKKMAAQALSIASEANNDGNGIIEATKKSLNTSNSLNSNITNIKNNELKQMNGKKSSVDTRYTNLNNKLNNIIEAVNLAEETLNQHKELNIFNENEVNNIMNNVETLNMEIKPEIEELDNKTKKLTENREDLARALLNSDTQLKEASKVIPKVSDRIQKLNEKMNNNTNKITEYKNKINLLKEKIALARDKTNMIKLSAHFEPHSYLELPLNAQDSDITSYTEIKFFFRTNSDNGLLIYLGNEARHQTTEFIAFEIKNKQPKLSIDFGKGITSSILPVNVNDNQWRELLIYRTGKNVKFEISKPFSDEIEQSKEFETKEGRSVLNLDPDSHRIFLGGFPNNFHTSTTIQRKYTGDIDTLRVNGILIGLWNSKKTSQVLGAPRRPLFSYEAGEESAVSFNGDGYLQIGVGNSNLRKRTTVLLSFMTYQPDGLLFFVGKDDDQLVIELTGGRVQLSFDLGSGLGRLVSNNDNYNDGKWHTVHINRVERQAKLDIDGKDIVEGESPGTLFEMSVTGYIYLGGLPFVETRFTVQPFRGCLKNLKIDSEYANLNNPKAAKGIQPSCPFTLARVASFLSERSRLSIDKVEAKDRLDLSLRFRTEQTLAHIVSIFTQDNENLLKAIYDNGMIHVSVNGDDEQLQVPLTDGNDGNWHYLNIIRKENNLIVIVNDRTKRKLEISNINDYLPNKDLKFEFGKNDDGQNIEGCIGDVILNGKIINFASSKLNEVTLTTCKMSISLGNKSLTLDEQDKTSEDVKTTVTPTEVKTTKEYSTTKVVPSGSCALPLTPYGEREDSTGYRFGVEKGSHLEFDRSLSTLENDLVFSIQARAEATNGYIFFMSNEKQTEFITLYLNDGYVNFLFGQLNNYVHLTSDRSILDHDWHTVSFKREGKAGVMFIDDVQVANNESVGLEIIQVQAPIYIGGVTSDLIPITSKIFNRKELPIKNEFGGCLRDFKLNGKKFNNPDREYGIKQCSDIEESGIFFGKDGGYAILDHEFEFTSSIILEMEIRPRTKNAVLLSVGVLEYVTVQLVDGNVVLTVDLGGGRFNATASHNFDKVICDGHWHHIKILMKRNIITVSVDQRSGMTFIKQNKGTVGKDRLYLGGTPKGKKHPGIIENKSFVGCIRNVVYGSEKTEYKLNELNTFGDVIKNSCPLN